AARDGGCGGGRRRARRARADAPARAGGAQVRVVRLRLRNCRGTVEREVRFDEHVTVVEGPNEVGKSTLTEALRLLLDHDVKSDSRKQAVERIRPIGRDVVPEIEAEIEAPPYRFVFRKRFSPRKRDGGGTELELLAPRVESLA